MGELFLLVLAMGVSFLGSILGIGGGAFLVPAMVFSLNMEPTQAMSISLISAFGTGVSGSINRATDGQVIKLAVLLVFPAILGTWFFTPLAYQLNSNQIMQLFIGLILAIVFLQRKKVFQSINQQFLPTPKKHLFGVGASLLAGAGSGLLGIGGGVILVPLLRILVQIPIKMAVQVSLAIMIFTSTIGLWIHSSLGMVHWQLGSFALVGSFCGGILGAKVRGKISPGALSRIFTVVAMSTVAALIFRISS